MRHLLLVVLKSVGFLPSQLHALSDADLWRDLGQPLLQNSWEVGSLNAACIETLWTHVVKAFRLLACVALVVSWILGSEEALSIWTVLHWGFQRSTLACPELLPKHSMEEASAHVIPSHSA